MQNINYEHIKKVPAFRTSEIVRREQGHCPNDSIIIDFLLATSRVRTGKEIRFRFGSSEDKAGKEAKRRPTG